MPSAHWLQVLNKIENICQSKSVSENSWKNSGSDKTQGNAFDKIQERLFFWKFSVDIEFSDNFRKRTCQDKF